MTISKSKSAPNAAVSPKGKGRKSDAGKSNKRGGRTTKLHKKSKSAPKAFVSAKGKGRKSDAAGKSNKRGGPTTKLHKVRTKLRLRSSMQMNITRMVMVVTYMHIYVINSLIAIRRCRQIDTLLYARRRI